MAGPGLLLIGEFRDAKVLGAVAGHDPSDASFWSTVAALFILGAFVNYASAIHAKAPQMQTRASGLARVIVGAGYVYLGEKGIASNILTLFGVHDLITGIWSLLVPSVASLIPNTLITFGFGTGLLMPLRNEMIAMQNDLSAPLKKEPLPLPTSSSTDWFFVASVLALGIGIQSVVIALTFENRAIRGMGKLCLGIAVASGVAFLQEFLDIDSTAYLGGLSTVTAALILATVPKDVARSIHKKQKAI